MRSTKNSSLWPLHSAALVQSVILQKFSFIALFFLFLDDFALTTFAATTLLFDVLQNFKNMYGVLTSEMLVIDFETLPNMNAFEIEIGIFMCSNIQLKLSSSRKELLVLLWPKSSHIININIFIIICYFFRQTNLWLFTQGRTRCWSR